MKIDIIGAGIAGLTTAIALQQKGITTRIFEQAPAFKTVGAGIVLANNAMQVFQHLGMTDRLYATGNRISALKVTNRQLKALSTIDLTEFEQKYGVQNLGIHRADLLNILLEELGDTEIIYGKKLVNIEPAVYPFSLDFEDGSQYFSENLIGADGIHSRVRNALFKETPLRYAKQFCWRGVCDFVLPKEFSSELNEAWGRGERFGFMQINPKQVYWFALTSYKKSADEVKDAKPGDLFQGFHPLVLELLAATKQTHQAEITDFHPISNWQKGKACLIGDAAHAMTPNMGQGAGQSIEDAYILANKVAELGIPDAFPAFQKYRKAKVDKIIKTSWAIGKIAHFKNPLLAGWRDFAFKITPKVANSRAVEGYFKL